jgi:deazaflavin-dependent oxidoreductase (nitroreductase family)
VPIPSFVARINRRVANPVVRRFAGRSPGFAIVEHRGRTSGRRYQTPVNVVVVDDGFLIALTYGSTSDWVRNIFAAGGGTLVYRQERIEVVNPRIVEEEGSHSAFPAVVRAGLKVLDVRKYLELDRRAT